MFFSQEDYRKIYDWLKCHSIKDSEFAITDLVDNDDTIAILHNGMNCRVSLGKIMSLIPRISINKDLNILTFEGKSYQLTPYEGSAVVVETITTYSDITLNLSYPKVPANGGSVNPIYSYNQNKTITKIYSDGRVVDNTETITTGANVLFTTTAGTINASTGALTIGATTSTTEIDIASVTVKVTMNDKECIKTVSVKQLPVVTNWYMGQVNGTKTAFTALSVNDLKTYSETIPVTTKSKSVTINHHIWYVMIPSEATINGASFISGGITSTFTPNEIVSRIAWTLLHDDVTIDDKLYSVYAYRDVNFADSQVNGTFKIN